MNSGATAEAAQVAEIQCPAENPGALAEVEQIAGDGDGAVHTAPDDTLLTAAWRVVDEPVDSDPGGYRRAPRGGIEVEDHRALRGAGGSVPVAAGPAGLTSGVGVAAVDVEHHRRSGFVLG